MTVMASSSAAAFTTVDGDGASTISTVHPDIIQTQILNRLDGQTLASAASASSHLRSLCKDETLWRDICTAMWPSLDHQHVRHVISNFLGGHRSLFSDSFPTLHHSSLADDHLDRSFPATSEWISAVDIYYQDTPIFSKVHRTETQTAWFGSSPLWINLLDPKELVPIPRKYTRKDEDWMTHLEENLNLSWIMIDPTRKRAANLSSRRPVSAQRHWLTRDMELVYAVVIACEERASEWVQCNIKVTCCGEVGGEMHVREVSLMVEDTEGRNICGKQSMVILQKAIENGKRKKVKEEEAKARFEQFLVIKRERREKKARREQALDMVFIFIVITIFAIFCWFVFL